MSSEKRHAHTHRQTEREKERRGTQEVNYLLAIDNAIFVAMFPIFQFFGYEFSVDFNR